MCGCQELISRSPGGYTGWSISLMNSRLCSTLLILLSVQVLSLADQVYKIPLMASSYRVNFAEEDVSPAAGNLHGKPGQGYYIEMWLGTPPQKVHVLVDTGSSNFAVAAAPNPDVEVYFDRDRSSTFESEDLTVYVPYTQGDWEGPLGTDVVQLPSLPNITVRANIACITDSSNFFINDSHWQGILGMAYKEIARPDDSVEPFFDSLVKQTDVADVFSMQLCGTMDDANQMDISQGGTLILGGVDDSGYRGDIQYARINKEWYFEVVITDMKVNNKSLQVDCKEYNFDKTIVDSGTTNLRLPSKVFTKLQQAVEQHTDFQGNDPPEGFWSGEQVLCWPEGTIPYHLFPTVTISLAESHNTSFDLEVRPSQYLRAVGDEYDPTATDDCFKFAIARSDTGCVLGAIIMEGFYVIFDRENMRVGFADTTCPNREPVGSYSGVKASYYWNDTSQCAYIKPDNSESALMVAAYVMAAICGACMLPLLALVLHWQWQKFRRAGGYQRSPDDPLVHNENR